jgi:regulatory protein
VEIAIRWLGGRRRFEREVRAYLRASGYAAAAESEAVGRLKELGLLDDAETCRAFLRDRVRFAPKGRALLLAELMRKGVKAEVAEAALSEVFPPEAEADVASDWLLRSLRKWQSLPEGIARRRMWSALARRGFPREAARAALVRVAGERGDDESLSEEDGPGVAPEEP